MWAMIYVNCCLIFDGYLILESSITSIFKLLQMLPILKSWDCRICIIAYVKLHLHPWTRLSVNMTIKHQETISSFLSPPPLAHLKLDQSLSWGGQRSDNGVRTKKSSICIKFKIFRIGKKKKKCKFISNSPGLGYGSSSYEWE